MFNDVFACSYHDKLKNSKYIYDSEGQIVRDPNIKEEKGKKISFGEVSQFSQKQSPDTANGIAYSFWLVVIN
jgi:hypothetical protein